MIRSKEELLDVVKSLGMDDNDSVITLLEDISDTMDSVKDNVDWKARHDELDKTWRKKYHDRFFHGPDEAAEGPTMEPADEPEELEEKTSFDELFTAQ